MVKKWVWLFIIFIILIFIFFYLLYTIWGGKFYYDAKKSIDRLSSDKKVVAMEKFNTKGDYLYSGIYMGVFNNWPKGVWIWGAKGPRFFQSDDFTVYSHIVMCTDNNLEKIAINNLIIPERNIYTDINVWKKEIKTGNFIAIQLATPENGGNLGKLREAYIYDWWIFNSSIPIDTQCKN